MELVKAFENKLKTLKDRSNWIKYNLDQINRLDVIINV